MQTGFCSTEPDFFRKDRKPRLFLFTQVKKPHAPCKKAPHPFGAPKQILIFVRQKSVGRACTVARPALRGRMAVQARAHARPCTANKRKRHAGCVKAERHGKKPRRSNCTPRELKKTRTRPRAAAPGGDKPPSQNDGTPATEKRIHKKTKNIPMPTINYDLRKMPMLKDREEIGYYPVISHPKKLTGDDLCKLIQDQCTLTTADVKAVLAALSSVMGSHLGMGVRVEVPELGYFSTGICSDKRISDPYDKEIARHLHVDNVRFKPMSSLRKRLSGISFRRTRDHEEDAKILETEELEKLLGEYFSKSGGSPLTRADFQSLTGYRKTTANKTLGELVERGALVRFGRKNAPYYRLPEESCDDTAQTSVTL